MNRVDFLNLLHRRHKTVRYATASIDFLEALSRPLGYDPGEVTEVDGDALAILRKGATS